jgi:hypothetical protein
MATPEGKNAKTERIDRSFADGLLLADDMTFTIEVTSNPESPASDAAARADAKQTAVVRRRGGPRTPAGKQRSRYNALKNGFFANEAVIEAPFYRESRKEYRRLLQAYMADKQPIGIAEMHQVELAVMHLVSYERLKRVEQALILERHTPLPKKDISDSNEMLRELLRGKPASQAQRSEVDEAEALLAKERARIDKLRKSLPSFDDVEWLHRCESHILRQYYRALYELERLQSLRLGRPSPPTLRISRE